MLERYLPRIEFDSYEDFKKNYTVNAPEYFNFGWDIVDGWAEEKPDLRALLWCDDFGDEKIFTFKEMSLLSNKAANYFKSLGLKRGDVVTGAYSPAKANGQISAHVPRLVIRYPVRPQKSA